MSKFGRLGLAHASKGDVKPSVDECKHSELRLCLCMVARVYE
jgi:hypothetical protein